MSSSRLASESAGDGAGPEEEPSYGGDLFVLSAPSGAGKSTLIRMIFERFPELARRLAFSVSHATRAPREGEVDGRHYYFIDKPTFEGMIEENRFLEWAEVHGQYKGTSLDEVERLRAAGRDVLLEIDVQGAAQVRRRVQGAVSVFVLPPSYSALERRLRGRGSESEAQIQRRLEDAVTEIRASQDYDYVILNDDLTAACEALAAVFHARQFHHDRMQSQIQRVLRTLPAASGSSLTTPTDLD